MTAALLILAIAQAFATEPIDEKDETIKVLAAQIAAAKADAALTALVQQIQSSPAYVAALAASQQAARERDKQIAASCDATKGKLSIKDVVCPPAK